MKVNVFSFWTPIFWFFALFLVSVPDGFFWWFKDPVPTGLFHISRRWDVLIQPLSVAMAYIAMEVATKKGQFKSDTSESFFLFTLVMAVLSLIVGIGLLSVQFLLFVCFLAWLVFSPKRTTAQRL